MNALALAPEQLDQHEADAALAERAARGDDRAVRWIVDRHLGPITRFAYRMLGDASEAEDIAQEAFLRLWRELPRWEPRARLTTWLHKVAHNLCVDRLRARRPMSGQDAPELVDPRGEPLSQLEAHQRSHAVARALAELPERQRAAVTLVYHQGLSNKQAAEVLGIEIDALESLLARGRQNLRKRLMQPQGAAGV